MNQAFQSIRVGIFFVLGLILIYVVYSVIGSGRLDTEAGYPIVAEFDDIRTLATGSDVRMAGVRIGKVSATELADGRGRITLTIDPAYSIPDDSVATIAMASLLGQNYVSVAYGQSAQTLGDGDEILTEGSADFNEILSEVKQLGERFGGLADSLPNFEGGDMGELFTNLNELVTDNRDRFDSIMTNLEELTGKLNRAEGTLGRLINEDEMYTELMTVVEDFQTASTDMREALAGARDLMDKVRDGEGTLGRLLSDDTLAADLEETMGNLKSFSEKLNSGEGTLGKLVNDDSLYFELQGMLDKADQALDSVGDSGPITAVGAISGALF